MIEQTQLTRQIMATAGTGVRSRSAVSKPDQGVSDFRRMLEKTVAAAPEQDGGGIKFSKHAQKRIESRNIRLSAQDMSSLDAAVQKARQKGAKESLILMKDIALVVSVRNNTVITAVDEQSSKENVFTNIDSAIIAR